MPGPHPDFTIDQADDLAKHFLGPEWMARESYQNRETFFELIKAKHKFAALPDLGAFHVGKSWRECFRRAGVKLPYRPRFVNVGRRVMVGQNEVSICASNKWAERIAKLLNQLEAS